MPTSEIIPSYFFVHSSGLSLHVISSKKLAPGESHLPTRRCIQEKEVFNFHCCFLPLCSFYFYNYKCNCQHSFSGSIWKHGIVECVDPGWCMPCPVGVAPLRPSGPVSNGGFPSIVTTSSFSKQARNTEFCLWYQYLYINNLIKF